MILIFLAYFLLASGISANKVLLNYLSPTFFVGIRMLCAGSIMIIYNYFKSNRMRFAYFKKDLIIIVIISLFTTFIPSILKAYGISKMFSSKAALIGSCDPFITAIYAYILFHENLTWKKFLGIVIGFLGIMLLLLAKSPIEEPLLAWFEISWPELALLGSVAIGRYGWILIRSLLKKERYSSTEINGLSMFLSGFLALIFSYTISLLVKYGITIPGFLNAIVAQPKNTISLITLSTLFPYTVIVGNIFGYGLFAYCLKKYNLTFISLAGFSIPLFVTLIGWIFLQEPITITFALSTIIIFAGLVIFNLDDILRRISK